MGDKFANMIGALDSPSSGGAAVTPHDTNELPIASRRLLVEGAGDLTVVTVDGSEVTFHSAADQYHELRVKQVKATGTDATGIVAFW